MVGTAISLAAAGASAQDDDRATIQDTTGLFWGVATFEILATVGAVLPAALGCETDVCQGLGPILGMLGGLSLGVAGWLAEWPADVPFVAHTSYVAFASGLMLGYGTSGLADDGEGSTTVGLIAGTATALALGTYTTIRRDDFVRHPDLLAPGHMMAWGTMGVLMAASVVLVAAGVEESVFATVIGAAAALFLSGMVAWAEVARR